MKRSISLFAFSCIVSLGTLLLYNIPFFSYVAENSNENVGGRIFLLSSLVVIMLALNFMMTYLVMFLLRMVGRIVLAILSLINATAVYFIYTYSVMIDLTTIENVFNTRYSEASGFFSLTLWLSLFVFGVLPALYCLLQPVVIGKAKRLGLCCGSSLGIIILVVLLNFNQTLWISQHDTELGGLLQPWSYVANTFRMISSEHDKQMEEIKLPASLKLLCPPAFAQCISLRKVQLDKNLKEIGDGAFCQCRSLREVEWNDSLRVIGTEAFLECKYLKTPVFDANVEIGKNAFKGCK